MKEKKDIPVKAKTLSNVSKTIASVFVLGVFITYVLIAKRLPSTDEAMGIVSVGIFIAGVFVPVDLSLIVKNIKGIKQ